MTDNTTQKITEPDDSDVTLVLSTQDMAKQIAAGAAEVEGDDTTAFFDRSSLFRFFGWKRRNVSQEIDDGKETAGLTVSETDGGDAAGDDRHLPDLAERYRMLRVFAEGGQARISLAFDRSLKRRVAVKSIRKELLDDPAFRDDFLYESRVTAALEHPSIVPVYSLNGDADGGLHLVMKLMTGKTLKKYLAETTDKYQQDGVVHFDEAAALTYRLEIFLKVCDALAYVHDRGMIHCDLKPENIMLGQYHETYVMDWGIARDLNDPPPDSHQTMGTPRYTSPENLLGRPCDTRSDIYTMGVILYELATLNPAFPDTDVTRVIHKVRRGEIAPLKHRFKTPIHRDLAAIIRKTTAFDPARRYQHISDLAADIRRFIRHEEVSANPDRIWGKMARFAYRHRRMVLLLAAMGFIAGITITLLGTWWNIMQNMAAEHRKDIAITRAVLGTRVTALAISDQFVRIGHLLELVESEALLLQRHRLIPETVDGTMVSVTDTEPFPEAYPAVYSSARNSLKCAVLRSMKDDPAAAQLQLRSMQPLFPRLRHTLLRSPVPGGPLTPPEDDAIREELLKKDRLPVRSAVLTMADGLQVIYPAASDCRTFDGRERDWYRDGMAANGANHWSEPYIDFGSDGRHLVISCSRMIGDRLGVAALDVPLHFLVRQLQANPPPYLIARMVVNDAGNVIAATTEADKWERVKPVIVNGEWIPQPFEEMPLWKQMVEKEMGALFTMHDGKTVLWCFWLIRSVGWVYVEKIDYDRLWDMCR